MPNFYFLNFFFFLGRVRNDGVTASNLCNNLELNSELWDTLHAGGKNAHITWNQISLCWAGIFRQGILGISASTLSERKHPEANFKKKKNPTNLEPNITQTVDGLKTLTSHFPSQ